MTTGVAIVAWPPCQVRHLSSQAAVWPAVPQAAAQMDVKYWPVNMSNPTLHICVVMWKSPCFVMLILDIE